MYQFNEAPQPQHHKEGRELALAAAQHDLEDERGKDDDGVEEVERSVRLATERIEFARAEGPDRGRDFDEKNRGDGKRDVREDVEPPGCVGAFDGGALLGEEGVGEICEDAGRVDEDLFGGSAVGVRRMRVVSDMVRRYGRGL